MIQEVTQSESISDSPLSDDKIAFCGYETIWFRAWHMHQINSNETREDFRCSIFVVFQKAWRLPLIEILFLHWSSWYSWTNEKAKDTPEVHKGLNHIPCYRYDVPGKNSKYLSIHKLKEVTKLENTITLYLFGNGQEATKRFLSHATNVQSIQSSGQGSISIIFLSVPCAFRSPPVALSACCWLRRQRWWAYLCATASF